MINIKIANHEIGPSSKCFIIAELSANHNQDYETAVKTIKAMKESGADAVKLQTYTADTITLNCDNKHFQIDHGTLWDGKTLHQLYEQAHTPWDWQAKLKTIAEDLGLICFSSPFDKSAVDFLEQIEVPAYKIASFEITDIPLIEYTASKQKPIIISTGIATLSDIEEAVNTCKNVGNDEIILLKCTSSYPAPYEEINLLTIPDLSDRFQVNVGISDHTMGIAVPVAATALGAKLIEKHFILDKNIKSPDAAFSLDPQEFKNMVDGIRNTEKALGKISYELTESAQRNRIFSRSLFVVKDLEEGDILTQESVRSIRPGHGLHPKYYSDVLGKKTSTSISAGTPLSRDLLA